MNSGVISNAELLIQLKQIVLSGNPHPRTFATSTCRMLDHAQNREHVCCEESKTSHLEDPIPHEPVSIPHAHIHPVNTQQWPLDFGLYLFLRARLTLNPSNGPRIDDSDESSRKEKETIASQTPLKRCASTLLIPQSPEDVQRILVGTGEARTRLVEKIYCGGGCCFLNAFQEDLSSSTITPLAEPPFELLA